MNLNPSNLMRRWRAEALLKRARKFYDLEDYENCIVMCNQALAFDIDFAPAYHKRGLAKHDLENYTGAIEDYTQAIALDYKKAQFVFDRGRAYSVLKEKAKARDDFSRALNLDSYNILYMTHFIPHAIEQGNLSAALHFADKAIFYYPDAMTYLVRGVVYIERGEYQNAINDFDQAIQLGPRHKSFYEQRANAHYLNRELDKAREDYNKAIQLDPENTDLYSVRGVVYFELNQIENAVTNYTKIISLNDTLPNAYSNRGEGYFILQDYPKALADFEKAIELEADSAYGVAGQAITLHVLGRIGEAQTIWRGLVAKNAQYSDAEWVGTELNWKPSLVAEAKKLISGLLDTGVESS